MSIKRLCISISEDLHKRIEPYRNKMNISKICTDALEIEIHRREVFSEATSELSEQIVDKMKEIDPGVDVSGVSIDIK